MRLVLTQIKSEEIKRGEDCLVMDTEDNLMFGYFIPGYFPPTTEFLFIPMPLGDVFHISHLKHIWRIERE